MQLNFRQAQIDDLESLVEMLAQDPLGKTRENLTKPLDPNYLQAFNAIHSDPNNQLIVVLDNLKVIGMLQLTFIPYLTHKGSWRCLIEGVRVHSDYRGRSVGEKMFDYAINLAKQKSCNIVQLTSDKKRPDAIRFYEKLGFTSSHEGFKLSLETRN